jgi:toxin YoeB
MDTVSYTTLRQNLSSIMEKITKNREVISITRKGHESMVMMTESDYNSVQETLYLLSSRKNAERLEESFEQAESNVKVYNRLKDIIRNIAISPYEGVGKPEPLKYSLSGKWSRRLTKEHRLVYELKDKEIIIYQCRFHY